ncbi:MAG TPA: heavy metal-binding domain-containing protein [Gemmatimonadaceae bacterium]
MNPTMVTTAFELTGYRIGRTLGVVRGVTVRSRSLAGNIGAAFQTIMGGNISLLTELCEHSRAEAFELMLRHASDLGANGIIAVRYDATEVMSGVTEVLCYGTAIVAELA